VLPPVQSEGRSDVRLPEASESADFQHRLWPVERQVDAIENIPAKQGPSLIGACNYLDRLHGEIVDGNQHNIGRKSIGNPAQTSDQQRSQFGLIGSLLPVVWNPGGLHPICNQANMDGNTAMLCEESQGEGDVVWAAINDGAVVNNDVFAGMRCQEPRLEAQKCLVFALPFVARRAAINGGSC